MIKKLKNINYRLLGKQMLSWLGKFALFFLISSLFFTILYRFVPVPITPLMIKRCIEQKWNGKPLKLEKTWTSLDDISEHLMLAVVAAEDQKFEEHNGFDFEAIEKAIELNKKNVKRKKTKVYGASTISQQVAKNVFLLPNRSWLRKGLEVYFTVLIEFFWSKERIMAVYLNVAEMGDGIYGAQAASKIFFKKNATDLRPSEAALIAAVLPNPLKWSPQKPTDYLLRRKNWILRQMAYLGNSLDLTD